MRDHNQEFQDNEGRQYAYHFDEILRDYIIQELKPFFLSGRALELGCFHGDVTQLIMNHYDDITVVEAASDLIKHTKNRLGSKIKFVHSTFESFSTTEKFDAIFLIHTLEHLDDPISILKKIKQWLSAKGRLFLVCPNANAPSRQIAVKIGLIDHNQAVTDAEIKHGHRKTYTLDTLESDARNAKIKVIKRGGVFFKGLANFQLDKALESQIINQDYLDGCYQFGMCYPNLCASIYIIGEKGDE